MRTQPDEVKVNAPTSVVATMTCNRRWAKGGTSDRYSIVASIRISALIAELVWERVGSSIPKVALEVVTEEIDLPIYVAPVLDSSKIIA